MVALGQVPKKGELSVKCRRRDFVPAKGQRGEREKGEEFNCTSVQQQRWGPDLAVVGRLVSEECCRRVDAKGFPKQAPGCTAREQGMNEGRTSKRRNERVGRE